MEKNKEWNVKRLFYALTLALIMIGLGSTLFYLIGFGIEYIIAVGVLLLSIVKLGEYIENKFPQLFE